MTITGAGGCGKTRLALEVARANLARFGDGVWLVELASVADGALVSQTIVASPGIPSAGRPLDEVLSEFLHNRQVLLVVDNCEHVIESCALVVERLLQSCPGLRVLATTRERLDVPGEAAHRVSGLALAAEGATAEDVACSEAGQLFLERAGRLVPELCLDEDGGGGSRADLPSARRDSVGDRVGRDRRPRALPQELAVRLDDRFRLLRAGGRTAPPRHQTLRATMDWSHQLLDAGEVAALPYLAVVRRRFRHRGTRSNPRARRLPVLLRCSISRWWSSSGAVAASGIACCETVREYADEKLVDSGEAATLRDKHCDYYLALAEEGAAGCADRFRSRG